MSVSLTTSHVTVVALRKESVDRNQYLSGVLDFGPGSLSARRAWIEISIFPGSWISAPGRSPQGERG